jgi:hypothetical protein
MFPHPHQDVNPFTVLLCSLTVKMRPSAVLLFRRITWKVPTYQKQPEMKKKMEMACKEYYNNNKARFDKRGIVDAEIR